MSQDQLYESCQLLNFFVNETDYVLLLRDLATTSSTQREEYLRKKIQTLKRSKELTAGLEKLKSIEEEVHFLLSPIAWLTYFSLGIRKNRENPRNICHNFNITIEQLKIILQNLVELSLIEVGDHLFNVIKVNKNHFHYGPTHPLMRVHQQLLRSFCDSQLMKLGERDKKRLMVTFNSNPATIREINEKFSSFIKEVEKLAVSSYGERSYQLNFDLFCWD